MPASAYSMKTAQRTLDGLKVEDKKNCQVEVYVNGKTVFSQTFGGDVQVRMKRLT